MIEMRRLKKVVKISKQYQNSIGFWFYIFDFYLYISFKPAVRAFESGFAGHSGRAIINLVLVGFSYINMKNSI